MVFDEGPVFKNVENFFKYYPNKTINSKAYYNINDTWYKEYDYLITTNNFGLVQKNNIVKNKDSILFLGDSFVEGQGADAWLNKFDGKFKNYQIINGGILGTGPQQFELLEKHISNEFEIKKVIFFYIGDDFRRGVFSISDKSLNCIKNFRDCKGNENFYGFPSDNHNNQILLNKLYEYRVKQNENLPFKEKIKINIKNKFSNLYTIKITKNYLRQNFYFSKNEIIQKNFQSIENLYKKYRDSIIFVQLKNKNEIIHGKEYDTFFAEEFIKKISKKHFICDFENDITNFYKIDMHPNEKGYNSLFNCVNKILSSQL